MSVSTFSPLSGEPSEEAALAASAGERSYRLCYLDPNGEIARTEVLRARNDRAALALLRKIASRQAIELRHGPRWVGCVPAKSKTDPSRRPA